MVQYRYTYDGLGQLTREDNRPLGYSYRYLYDDAGNITNKIRYAFTTGTLGTATSTVTYGYNDATWGDLLTSYDGVNIEYDAIGNPKYIIESESGDYVSGKWLQWEGRQLKAYHTAYGYSGELDEIFESIEFTYNADGIRIGKNVYGTEYEYIVSGSQILAEKWQYGSYGHFMQYLYDESGAPIGINYRSNSYAEDVFDVFYFEKNLQGDIVAIYNDSGVRIGTYTYDAWGNFTVSTASGITSLEHSIVHTYNPFRYRGYYYDVDMGMYYLQSRYYNPQWGRFLNADEMAYLGTNQGIYGMNLFIYCSNNPIMGTDPTGNSWFKDKWDAFTNWLGSVFGAGASVSSTAEYEEDLIHPLSPITASTGVSESIIDKSYGDSSKPISVYANAESANLAFSSSAGLKINIGKFSLKISLALDNTGISGSWNDGTTVSEFGYSANFSELKLEGKYSVTSGTTTTYTKAGVSAWLIMATAYAIQTGDTSYLQHAYVK